jgi:phage terminase large subunit GpA-like protein
MRVLHLDEIDVYPQRIVKGSDSSADPIEKAERRADSFGNIKKIAGISTPKDEATSRIEKKVNEGDRRFYNITCPKCGLQQPLLWANLRWDKNADGFRIYGAKY